MRDITVLKPPKQSLKSRDFSSNSKSEARNPKQARRSKIQMIETKTRSILEFDHLNLFRPATRPVGEPFDRLRALSLPKRLRSRRSVESISCFEFFPLPASAIFPFSFGPPHPIPLLRWGEGAQGNGPGTLTTLPRRLATRSSVGEDPEVGDLMICIRGWTFDVQCSTFI